MPSFDKVLDPEMLAVDRACDDLRRGLPVIVKSEHGTENQSALLILPLEQTNSESLGLFESLQQDVGLAEACFLITHHRAETIKVAPENWQTVRISRPHWMTPQDMVALADPTLDMAAPLKGPFQRLSAPPLDIDLATIQLLKLARLLPAALIAPFAPADADILQQKHHILSAAASAIHNQELCRSAQLKQVAQAQVPLEGFEATKLISFRPLTGGVEHIAIIIGDPPRGQNVLTRLHSECFTGDLLGSLKCDCGDQLKGAVKAIAAAGGGIILYLAQEGRGIGLISKLKAYALQDQGFDTVDANTRLGFEVDERVFKGAAEMLKALHVGSIRLMTNNPNKVAQLESFGVQVSERVNHVFPTNPHNHAYLATKKDRTGHML